MQVFVEKIFVAQLAITDCLPIKWHANYHLKRLIFIIF